MKVVITMENLCYMEFTITTRDMPEGVALNTMVGWLVKGGFSFFVFNDDGTFHVPDGEPQTIPKNWIIDPAQYVVQYYTKQTPPLNLTTLPEEVRNVVEAMDEYVKTVENRVHTLERQVDQMQRRLFVNNAPTPPFGWKASQIYNRNGNPTPPFCFHPDNVPPGYPGYRPGLEPRAAFFGDRSFDMPMHGHDHSDVFDGGPTADMPPYNWGQPPRRQRR